MNQILNRELLTGKVIKELYAYGSKTEREAHFLVVKKERLLLRRAGENAMSDPVLDPLVNKKIAAWGYRHLGSFVMESYSLVKPKARLDNTLHKLFPDATRSLELSEEMANGKRVCKITVFKVKPRTLINETDGTMGASISKREVLNVVVGDSWDTAFGNLWE